MTRLGYRLWIDSSNRAYPTASPFMGFPHDPYWVEIGLRDGLRYDLSSDSPYPWTFTRPKSETEDPVLRIVPKFFGDEGAALSDQTNSFESWQLSGTAENDTELAWQETPVQPTYSAFLRAQTVSENDLRPVVEMKWDQTRPDQVGLRLANTPANDRVNRWRLRIVDGSRHLWRELQIGDQTISADQATAMGSTSSSNANIELQYEHDPVADTRLRWQTNETLPLQVIEKNQKPYIGLALYQGLPIALGMEIPAAFKPTFSVRLADQHPNHPDIPFPGGAVFDELQVDIDATDRDWIWLRAGPRKSAAAGTDAGAGSEPDPPDPST